LRVVTDSGGIDARPLTVPEAAARLNVSPRFIRRLVDERRIPFHRVGRFIRLDPADLDDFLDAGRVEASAPRQ
jgi:excisionase family DNA binding protein